MKINSKNILVGFVLGSILLFSGNVFADYWVRRCAYGYCNLVRVIDRPYWRHQWYRGWGWHGNRWHHWRRW
jgi:hypothetical protein